MTSPIYYTTAQAKIERLAEQERKQSVARIEANQAHMLAQRQAFMQQQQQQWQLQQEAAAGGQLMGSTTAAAAAVGGAGSRFETPIIDISC